jgi:hypothetical protein
MEHALPQPSFCAVCTEDHRDLILVGRHWLCRDCRPGPAPKERSQDKPRHVADEHHPVQAPHDSPVGMRLAQLGEQMETASSAGDVAKLLWLLAEALAANVIVGFAVAYAQPYLDLTMRLSGPPWAAMISARMK